MADAGIEKSEFVAPDKANDVSRLSGPEIEALLANQRKNTEAMAQASWLLLDGIQAVWRRQLDYVQESVEGLTALARNFDQPTGSLKERFAEHTQYSKQVFEKNYANAREIAEMATEVIDTATGMLNRRFYEALDEMSHIREKRNR
jgi:phasin family protein